MLKPAINTLRFLRDYGDSLLADISASEFADQPVPGMNPPAWIVGHMAYALDRHATLVGLEPKLARWKDLFAKGSSPGGSPYPHKDNLVSAWREAIDRLIAGVEAAPDETLAGPNEYLPTEKLPTVGDFLTYSMAGHTATHLGQLSAWRRAAGRPPLF
ncbi:MAG: DinB family protein [Planctomycetota bacterium]